jgi:predicted DsbA family dithiol-disulfide isomerase
LTPRVTATLFTDPGCPFGYSFRPAEARLRWRFGDQIEWRLRLIGLAESAEEYEERGLTPAMVVTNNRSLARRFGMPFAFAVKPRVPGTARACRAVIAARELDPRLGEAALRALQHMQFTTAGLLDDDDDLRAALARVPGLDADEIVGRIDDEEIVAAYRSDHAAARSAAGSAAAAQGRTADVDGGARYTAPSVTFTRADGASLQVGGFQPFEAYDTALANLDPQLERRPAPEDALTVLEAFPYGLTTAEVAEVMRPGDTAEPAFDAVAEELATLAEQSRVVCEIAGTDALWRLPRADERRDGAKRARELAGVA